MCYKYNGNATGIRNFISNKSRKCTKYLGLFTLAVRRVQHPFQSLIYKRKLICFYHPIPNQEGSLAEKLN